MNKSNIFLEIFDSLFIMILCFGTLLMAMLMKGSAVVIIKYTINFATFTLTILGLGIYLFLSLTQSEKELKNMIKEMYDNE